jgi:uncharacterized membrane protein YuzA (DUF378 family)
LEIFNQVSKVSALGISILFIFCGLIALILRIFFFEYPQNIKGEARKIVKINSFVYIITGISSILIGLLLFTINYHRYEEPFEVLAIDFEYMHVSLGLIISILSLGLFIFNEKIIANWKANGIKVTVEKSKYRSLAIRIGVIIFTVGLLLAVL